MNFDIDRYQGINQRAQTWGLTGYMRAEWHDARLEFNGTASRASHLTLFPAQRVASVAVLSKNTDS